MVPPPFAQCDQRLGTNVIGVFAEPGGSAKSGCTAAIGAGKAFGKRLQLFAYGGKLGEIVDPFRTVPEAQRHMGNGEIVPQMEIEQMNHGLEGFGRNQGYRKAMDLFADGIVFLAKGNQFGQLSFRAGSLVPASPASGAH